MKKRLMPTVLDIALCMVCLACFMPPLYIFADALYLPKMYMLLAGVAVCLVCSPFVVYAYSGKMVVSGYLRRLYLFYLACALFECLYVIVDMIVNGADIVGESGTFDNPAGLALSLCVALPMACHMLFRTEKKKERLLYAVAILLFVSIIILSKSRIGVVCVAVFSMMLALKMLRMYMKRSMCRIIVCSLFVSLTIVSVVAYVCLNKSESTSGRGFIYTQSWNMLVERPWTGWGHGGFERSYMLGQASYFSKNPKSEYAFLADDVQHPLSEFVYLWFNYGVYGPVLLLAALLLPIWLSFSIRQMRAFETLLPLVAVLLFSMFSYAFHYQASWVAIGVAYIPYVGNILSCCMSAKRFVACASIMAGVVMAVYVAVDSFHEYEWHKYYRMSVRGEHDAAMRGYEKLRGYFNDDRFFLYSYAMAAFMADDMDRAYYVMEECRDNWEGYDVELLSGDICLRSRRLRESVEHFNKAHSMCPVRFAPLEGLYKAFDRMGNAAARDSVAKMIAEKEVKVASPDVFRIKQTCKEKFDVKDK